MARLLIRGEWYDQIAPTALYEGEFETIFLQNADKVFPDHFVVPFKRLVKSEYGNAIPDLALIDRKYRSWWVVEVELSHHSLTGHVIPQVQVFATGEYDEQHAKYLCTTTPELDHASVLAMLKGQPPQVLVVVNAPCPEWIPVLRRFGAIVTVFEIFRSRLDRQVFRLNGEQPARPSSILTKCEFDRMIPKFLRLLSPAAFPCPDGEVARLAYEGATTDWKRVDARDKVWLVPIGPNPLRPDTTYEIVEDESGVLSIRPSTQRR